VLTVIIDLAGREYPCLDRIREFHGQALEGFAALPKVTAQARSTRTTGSAISELEWLRETA